VELADGKAEEAGHTVGRAGEGEGGWGVGGGGGDQLRRPNLPFIDRVRLDLTKLPSITVVLDHELNMCCII
jgi:hypothetical protein